MSWRRLWTWRYGRNKHPSILRNEQLVQGFDATRDIESYEFVAFDTELTGLSPRRDEIVSIAAIRIRGLRLPLDDSFHSFLRTKKESDR